MNTNKCLVCHLPSKKRCSQCNEAWYCNKECQRINWPLHKGKCTIKKLLQFDQQEDCKELMQRISKALSKPENINMPIMLDMICGCIELKQSLYDAMSILQCHIPEKYIITDDITDDIFMELNNIKDANHLYCIALCILNPSTSIFEITYEHRCILLKIEDTILLISSYMRKDYSIYIAPHIVKCNIDIFISDLKTLKSNGATNLEKIDAYCNICNSNKEILGPLLRSINWNHVNPTYVIMGFQGIF